MAEAKKIKTESRIIQYDTDGEITTEYIEYVYYPAKKEASAGLRAGTIYWHKDGRYLWDNCICNDKAVEYTLNGL